MGSSLRAKKQRVSIVTFPLSEIPQASEIHKTGSRAAGWEKRERGSLRVGEEGARLTEGGNRASVWGDKRVLEVDCACDLSRVCCCYLLSHRLGGKSKRLRNSGHFSYIVSLRPPWGQ